MAYRVLPADDMQTRIGKYVLKKKLGAGASGSVYLALDEFSGQEVALKFYDAGKAADMPNFARSQFLTEAAVLVPDGIDQLALQTVAFDDASELRGLRQALGLKLFAHESHADAAGSGLHRQANFESGVAGQLHVGFPFGRTGEIGLAIARVA